MKLAHAAVLRPALVPIEQAHRPLDFQPAVVKSIRFGDKP